MTDTSRDIMAAKKQTVSKKSSKKKASYRRDPQMWILVKERSPNGNRSEQGRQQYYIGYSVTSQDRVHGHPTQVLKYVDDTYGNKNDKSILSYVTQKQLDYARNTGKRMARKQAYNDGLHRLRDSDEYKSDVNYMAYRYKWDIIRDSALKNRRRHATLARLGGKSPIRRAHEAYDAGVYTVPSHRMIETLARRSRGFSHRR